MKQGILSTSCSSQICILLVSAFTIRRMKYGKKKKNALQSNANQQKQRAYCKQKI